jgi:hypothetical protein
MDDDRTLNKALSQALRLEVVKTTLRLSASLHIVKAGVSLEPQLPETENSRNG